MPIPTWCADMQLNDTDKVLGLFFIVGGMLATYMVNPQLIHHVIYGDAVTRTDSTDTKINTLAYTKAYGEWVECLRKDGSTFSNQCYFRGKFYERHFSQRKIRRHKYPDLLAPSLTKLDEEYQKLAKHCKTLSPLFGKSRAFKCKGNFFKNVSNIEDIQKLAKNTLRDEQSYLRDYYSKRQNNLRPLGTLSDTAYEVSGYIRGLE